MAGSGAKSSSPFFDQSIDEIAAACLGKFNVVINIAEKNILSLRGRTRALEKDNITGFSGNAITPKGEKNFRAAYANSPGGDVESVGVVHTENGLASAFLAVKAMITAALEGDGAAGRPQPLRKQKSRKKNEHSARPPAIAMSRRFASMSCPGRGLSWSAVRWRFLF